MKNYKNTPTRKKTLNSLKNYKKSQKYIKYLMALDNNLTKKNNNFKILNIKKETHFISLLILLDPHHLPFQVTNRRYPLDEVSYIL